MGITVQSHISADDFFTALKGKARKIAQEETQSMSASMKYIITHRLQLKGGNGRYPRWDPSPNNYPKSKKSFDFWKVQQRGDTEYWLMNGGNPSNIENHNYVRNLVTGKGWPLHMINAAFTGVKKDGTPSKIRAVGGLIFSTQMPNGLTPWLKIKRQTLIDNVNERIEQELK
jgi:hypothetical protein